jgi:RNase adaptor protein for sRNA GlmZ degradation
MKVTILSFSFKRGLPEDATGNGGGFVFDCRAMPNPFWGENLRGYTGRDKTVCDFFAHFSGTVEPFLEATETLVRQSIEQYKRDSRDHLQVAFGCTGGQHRSVYFAERMAERLSGIDSVEIEITHTAKHYWTTSHDSENRDIIFQEELR